MTDGDLTLTGDRYVEPKCQVCGCICLLCMTRMTFATSDALGEQIALMRTEIERRVRDGRPDAPDT